MGRHFVDAEWESLYSMLTFEDPNFDYVGISNHSINLSTCDNSHLRPFSHSAKFSPEPENESVFGSTFLLDDVVNEPDYAEDSRSGYVGSPNSPNIDTKRKLCDASKGAAPKKKARISKYNIRTKSEEEEEDEISKAESHTQISDVDEPNASQETSDGENFASKEHVISATSKGSKRASRGEATNPQSLYARKRRQRINERLRILQNLVPNGTKVDISTMLEEALYYVKFLQLQIKLLSSDELWMYAPIAYNGVDINQYTAISPFLL